MKYLKRQLLLLGVTFCMMLTSCSTPDTPQENIPTESDTTINIQTTESNETNDIQTTESDETTDIQTTESSTSDMSSNSQTTTLYIGTRNIGFLEYPLTYEGDLTPELLIQGIADLTGWDLTLAETVTTGKGGMSVCLSGESSLFVGPPDPQKEDFHVFSADQLAEMILDSIQKTLQMDFTGQGDNPDAIDIYYYMEGEQPLELPNLGLSWSLDEPYQWKVPKSE